jgi:hypothetical protein
MYGPAEIARDMMQILEGSADFKVRAELENHLLGVLRENGPGALAELLQSLPGHKFELLDEGSVPSTIRLKSPGPGTGHIVVDACSGPHSVSVNVTVEDEEVITPQPDPRHKAFYDIWERLLGASNSRVDQLVPSQKAVYVIGLLEAEVMNGGLGQYLTNTAGLHLEETLEYLDKIGALKTRGILSQAAELGAKYESYVEAWERRSADYESLDNEFMQTGEDLAGLTADAFLTGD